MLHPGKDFIITLMLNGTRMFHFSLSIGLSIKFTFVQRVKILHGGLVLFENFLHLHNKKVLLQETARDIPPAA